MPMISERKITKAGDRSKSITLPMEWLDFYELKVGDTVRIIINDIIIIIPPDMPEKEVKKIKERLKRY